MIFLRTPLRVVPRRAAPGFERKTLGSYPVSHDSYFMWKNKTTAWGGMITEAWSPHQLKIQWQWAQTFPLRWYGRIQMWFWPVLIQGAALWYCMEKIDHDAKELVKDAFWY